jgi:cobalt-zinc-cadmium efflux system outer membrane protein
MNQKNLITTAVSAIIAWTSVSHVTAESINSLVNEALQRNPELEYYRAAIAAAKGERRTAGEWRNPEVNGELGSKIVRDNGTHAGPLWSLGFEQPFNLGPRVALRKAIANHQIALAKLGLEDFELELANRVRLLAYKTIVARKKSAAAQETSQRLRELTRVLDQREPAGVGPLLEARVIEANTLTLDRVRIEAEREVQTASYELNQLRAAPAGTSVVLGDDELRFVPLPSVSQLVALALSGNFDVRMRAVELEQQGFKVKLSRTERWPEMTAGAFARGESADTDENHFGIIVKLPLPFWNQNAGGIETAKARESQAQASLSATLRKVENEIAGAAAAYTARLAEIAKWSPEVLGRMRQAAELADKNYRLGAVPISTYTELQKEYLQAQTALLDTQADALEARQKVELLIGQRASRRTTSEMATQYSK